MQFKRTLAMLLTIVMIIGMVPVSAFAAETPDGDWEYTVNDDNTVTIDYYNGGDWDLVVPETLEGYTVTAIGTRAFANLEFGSVTLPATLTSIANRAFYNTSLSTVYFTGKQEQWDALTANIGTNNENLLNAELHITYVQPLSLGETVPLEMDAWSSSRFSFTPEVSGWYRFDFGYCSAYGNYWSPTAYADQLPNGDYADHYSHAGDVHTDFFYLPANQKATFTVSNDMGYTATSSLTVGVVPTLALNESAEFTLDRSDCIFYAVTVPEDGQYLMSTETVGMTSSNRPSANLAASTENSGQSGMTHINGWWEYRPVTLTAGSTSLFRILNYSYSTQTSSFCLREIPEPNSVRLNVNSGVYSQVVGGTDYVQAVYDPSYASSQLTWEIEDESIAKIIETGDSYVQVEFVGGGSTAITVTTANGLSATGTLIGIAPVPMDLGETYTATFTDSSVYEYFDFTAPEDGYYTFTLGGCYEGNYYRHAYQYIDSCWNGSYENIYDGDDSDAGMNYCIYYLNAGTTVRMGLYSVTGNTIEVSYSVNYADTVTSLEGAAPITGMIGDTGFAVLSRHPYSAWGEILWEIADESIAVISSTSEDGYCWVNLLAGGTTTLTATCGDAMVEIPITVTAPTPLVLGETSEPVTLNYGEKAFFTFTAPQAGRYTFYMPYGTYEGTPYQTYMSLNSSNYEHLKNHTSDSGLWRVLYLEEGATLELSIYHYWGFPMTTTLCVYNTPNYESLTASHKVISNLVGRQLSIDVYGEPFDAFEDLSFSIADESIAQITSSGYTVVWIQLLGTGSTTLTISSKNGTSLEIPIIAAEPIQIGLNDVKELSTNDEIPDYFSFTAPEDGNYVFTTPRVTSEDGYGWTANMSLEDVYGDYDLFTWNGNDYGYSCYMYLESGTTVVMQISSYSEENCNYQFAVYPLPTDAQIICNTEDPSGLPGDYLSLYFSMDNPLALLYNTTYAIADESVAQILYTGNNYCELYLVSDGQTTLTVTNHDGTTLTVPITVNSGTPIALDESKSVTLDVGQEEHFLFVAPTDGYYTFYTAYENTDVISKGFDISHIGCQGAVQQLFGISDEGRGLIYQMEAGSSVSLSLYNPTGSNLTRSFTVFRTPEPETIYTNEKTVYGMVGESYYLYAYSEPNNSWSHLTWSVTDESIAKIVTAEQRYVHVEALAVGETTVVATSENGLSLTITLNVQEPVTLTLDQTYSFFAPSGSRTFFSFTAPEEAIYGFKIPYVNIDDDNRATMQVSPLVYDGRINYVSSYSTADYMYYFYRILPGEETILALYCEDSYDLNTSVTIYTAPAATGVGFDKEVIQGYQGDVVDIRYFPLPEGSFIPGYPSRNIENTNVAIISWDSSFQSGIHLRAEDGETNFTVYWGDFTGTVPVNILPPPSLTLGETTPVTLEYAQYCNYRFTAPYSGYFTLSFGSVYLPEMEQFASFSTSTGFIGNTYHVRTWDTDGTSYNIYYMEEGAQLHLTLESYLSGTQTIPVAIAPTPTPTTLEFYQSSLRGEPGEECYFSFAMYPDNTYGDVIVTVADPTVASVEKDGATWGYVTLIGNGKTTLNISCGEATASIPIISQAPLQISAEETNTYSHEAGTTQKYAFTYPETGFYMLTFTGSHGDFYYQYYNLTEGDGLVFGGGTWPTNEQYNLYIKANAGSTVVISIFSHQTGDFTVSAVKLPVPTSIELEQDAVVGYVNDRQWVYLNFAPENAFGTVEWSLSDTTVAEIQNSMASQVLLEFLTAGTTTLTATCGELSVSIPVTVKTPVILQPGVTHFETLDGGDSFMATFTAPTDGVYAFFSEYQQQEDGYRERFYIDDNGCYEGISYIDSLYLNDGFVRYYRMAAGTTLELLVRNQHGDRSITAGITACLAPPVTSITFDTDSITGVEDSTQSVRYTKAPWYATADVFWSVADPSIATISYVESSYCYVKLLTPGETKLIATCGDLSWSLPIKVNAPLALELDKPISLDVTAHNPVTLRFTFPETGVYAFTATSYSQWFEFYDGSYTGDGYIYGGDDWVDGGYRMFIGGNKGDSMDLVLYPYTNETVTFSAVTPSAPTDIYFDSRALSGTTGNFIHHRVNFYPSDAFADVTFTVDDESVVLVTGQDGSRVHLVCLKPGQTTLTATCGDLSVTIPVFVRDRLELTEETPGTVTLAPYETQQFLFRYPESGIYAFTATSSDPEFYLMDADWSGSNYEWYGSISSADHTRQTIFVSLDKDSLLYLQLDNDNEDQPLTITLEAIKAVAPTAIVLNTTEIVGKTQRSERVEASFLPFYATGNIQWSIADESVAWIEYAENTFASIYLAQPGQTTLTATCGDLSVTIPITVKAPPTFVLDEPLELAVERGNNTMVYFTAPADGIYAFQTFYVPEGDHSYVVNSYLSTYENGQAQILTHQNDANSNVMFVEISKGTRCGFVFSQWSEYDVLTTTSIVTTASAPTELSFYEEEIKGVVGIDADAYITFAPITAWAEITFQVADESIAIVTDSSNDYCYLQLLKVGKTTLTATCGDLSVSIPVTVNAPQVLELDKPAYVTLGEDAESSAYYQFTAPETGTYGFKTPMHHVSHPEYGFRDHAAYIYLYNYGELDSMQYDDCCVFFADLEKGQTVLLGMGWDMFGTVDTSVTAFPAEKPNAVYLDHEFVTLSLDSWFELYAMFDRPEAYGKLEWSVEGEAVEIGSRYSNTNVEIRVVKLGTATVTVSCGDISTSCTFTVKEPLSIQQDEITDASLKPGEANLYRFVAPKDGVYLIWVPYSVSSRMRGAVSPEEALRIYTDTINGGWNELQEIDTGDGCYKFIFLEAGTVLTFGVENTGVADLAVSPVVTQPETPKSLTADPTEISGMPGDAYWLDVQFDVPTAWSDLEWTVGDPDVVALEYDPQQSSPTSVWVHLLSDGETTITVTAECGLELVIPVSVSSFSITQQPFDQFAIEGATVTFSVGATGKDLSYRWYYRTTPTGNWKYSTDKGYNTNALTVEALAKRNGYQYICQITNADGDKLTTEPATMTVGSKIPISGGNYGSGYTSLSESLDNAGDGYVVLPGNMTEDLVISKDAYLDLNGHVLFGNVTINPGATLYVFDSATADYTAENCGGIIGHITGDLARSFNTPASYGHNYKYLALEVEKDVWTFHRYYLSVESVILAPCMEGNGYTGSAVNYRTVFKCNELVAEFVTAYGAKLSGDNTVYADILGSLKPGADSMNRRVTQLGGTLKTTNSAQENLAASLLAPSVSAYITLADGTELTSAGVTRSLQDLVKRANNQELTLAQEMAVARMYDLFKASMDEWSIDIRNIQAYGNRYFDTELPPALGVATQPQAVTVKAGDQATFSVDATGKGLTYRWYYRTSPTGNWKYSTDKGYNTNTLTVEALAKRNGYQYTCQITDVYGDKLTTNPVTLTVE